MKKNSIVNMAGVNVAFFVLLLSASGNPQRWDCQNREFRRDVVLRDYKAPGLVKNQGLGPPVLQAESQINKGSISGIVTAPDLQPIRCVSVTALRDTKETESVLRSFSSDTDDKGVFRFEALPEGTYEIQFDFDEIWLMKPISKRVTVRAFENTSVEIRFSFIDECNGGPLPSRILSDADATAVIEWTLRETFTGRVAPDSEVILSIANIKPQWLTDTLGLKLVAMSPTDIQKRADQRGDYMYWRVNKLTVKGSCVHVSFAHLWADGSSTVQTGVRTLLGESHFQYVLTKRSGEWRGRLLNAWIS